MTDPKDTFLEHFLGNHSSLYAFILSRGVRPDSADDVLQNVASTLWEKYDSFEQGTNFEAWAFSVTRFEVARHFGKRKRDSRVLLLDEETLESLEALEEEGHDDLIEFQKGILMQCVEKLGTQSRRLIELRYGDGMPFEEVAKVVKRSAGAMRIQICRIRKWLRDCVSGQLRGARV